MVLNIIQNAVQAAAPSSGTIFLKTDVDRNHHQVIFECEDTGPGIPDAIRQDIFKPFFTTKGVGEGTGLGLYISHEIVKLHGGTIDVTSEDGRGTSFTIELPCHRRET